MTLLKDKPVYKSMTAWGLALLAFGQVAEANGLLPAGLTAMGQQAAAQGSDLAQQSVNLVSLVGQILAVLGLRRALA